MAKKLLEKAGMIHLPPARPAAAEAESEAESERNKAKTAPGSMLQFMTAQSAAVKEAETLRERLSEFEGAAPVRRLDPERIRVSAWANRHADSFADAAFEALKSEISAAGGNVQPIKVRPVGSAAVGQGRGVGPSNPLDLSNAAGSGAGGGAELDYEIVFGHRRHRACLELGLPVLAMVEPIGEQDLFVQMERENRARKDLSAWEQGMMYARALDGGLYPSNRQLAAAIGRDLGDVGKALALARLPQAVVEAFASPLDLQYRWAKPLGDAQQRDPEGLVSRAREIRSRAEALTPKQVFERLIATPQPREIAGSAAPDIPVVVKGQRLATVGSDAAGRTQVLFSADLSLEQRARLARAIAAALGG